MPPSGGIFALLHPRRGFRFTARLFAAAVFYRAPPVRSQRWKRKVRRACRAGACGEGPADPPPGAPDRKKRPPKAAAFADLVRCFPGATRRSGPCVPERGPRSPARSGGNSCARPRESGQALHVGELILAVVRVLVALAVVELLHEAGWGRCGSGGAPARPASSARPFWRSHTPGRGRWIWARGRGRRPRG